MSFQSKYDSMLRHHRGAVGESKLAAELRPGDELRPVKSLDALATCQLGVVAAIRPNNIVAPVLYLNFVVPSASMDVLSPFIDNIADILAARKVHRPSPGDPDVS
jgi:hypothetical protein